MSGFQRSAAALAVLFCLLLASCGAPSVKEPAPASPSDLSSRVEEKAPPISADEAVKVLVDGEPVSEVFLLKYDWNGESFESEDSLNKIMMAHYALEGSLAPAAGDGSEITFELAASEGIPSSVSLTQSGNTVRANTGLPYDNTEIELTARDDFTYSFTLQYRKLRMYYYQLDCRWENGNTASYVFAVEKYGK